MKIMAGYDGSRASKNALDLAKKHAKAFGAEVYILTSMVKATERQLEDIEKAEFDLEGIKAFFQKDNVPCEVHLLIRGLSPGEDIVQFARENEIDEIIVGIQKKSKVALLNLIRSGVTTAFVSHNLQAVEEICNRVLWLDHGEIVVEGEPGRVIEEYRRQMTGG